MVILWTNLEGERVEPSPTSGSSSSGTATSGSKVKKVGGVAVKPSLPALHLPLIKTADCLLAPQPAPHDAMAGSNDDLRIRMLLYPRDADFSPDSGLSLSQCGASPATPSPMTKPNLNKKFPIVYG